MRPSESLNWDNHVYCSPIPGSKTVEQLIRHHKAGFDVVFLNLGDADRGLDHIIRMAAYYRSWLEAHPTEFQFIETLEDIEEAKWSNKLAVGFNVEGVYSIADQLDIIQLYFDIGVRWMLLVYNKKNLAGSGVHDSEDYGLTPFGAAVAAEMDRAGIIKCLSHTGYRTAMDVLNVSNKPCIFSHSNARSLHKHERNIPDALILACAETGGVIGVNGINIFLGGDCGGPEAMVRHIDYIAQLVGPDHVGIGLDYGYTDQGELSELLSDKSYWPAGKGYEQPINCVPPEAIEDIVQGLERLGYSQVDIRKILGENMKRVAAAVW